MEADVNRQSRRDFCRLASGAGILPAFVPSRVRGANDRLTYAVIGTGNRGRYLNRLFKQLGAECLALCDVYDLQLKRALEDTPSARTFVDYREMLDTVEGIDFVVIATPDHQHFPNLKAALEAGKDVYLEKPLSMNLKQSREMVEAVQATDRIVQVGMQRRSAPVMHLAKRLIEEGVTGPIRMARVMWNWNTSRPLDNSPLAGRLDWERFLGPAPRRPFEPMRYRSWRNFWDYSGGHMTDQGTHLLDVVQWFTEQQAPKSAVCHGQILRAKGAEVPDTFCAVFEYPGIVVTWSLTYCNDYRDGWSIEILGDRGTIVLDREGFHVYREPWRKYSEPIIEVKLPVPTEAHLQNFLDCVRTRQQPNCPVEVAMRAVAGPHLANLALKQGRAVRLADDLVTTG